MGLREDVKKGVVSIDAAIEMAADYSESIQSWLRRRKASGDKSPSKKAKGKKAKKNAQV